MNLWYIEFMCDLVNLYILDLIFVGKKEREKYYFLNYLLRNIEKKICVFN